MRLPVAVVFVHHSVTAVDSLGADMLELERIGRARFGRFSYSYVGHPDGVAEGAALTVGAHTAGHNSTALGYCFAGNYSERQLSARQVRDFREWRRLMVDCGALTPHHAVRPHQAVKATACPGANVLASWAALAAGPAAPTEEPRSMHVLVDPANGRHYLLHAGRLAYLASPKFLEELRAAGVPVLHPDPATWQHLTTAYAPAT